MPGDKYVKIRQESLVGLMIVIFVKRCLRPHFKDIATSKLKMGVKGHTGNKGSCSIRFQYKDSTLTFANAHLESGYKKDLPETRR